jgi:uncharacterized protein (DUF433 family)
MAERKHAILSASSAARWLACTPSARLEEQFPDTDSEYAAEGTLAHAIAELKVRKKFVEPMGPKKFSTAMNKLKKDSLYQEEMDRYTDNYLDYISGVVMSYKSAPHVAVELKLDLSRYAPESFGTGDCIVLGGDTLHVIDFKYGKGILVSPENNPQLMLYGLGALDAYGMLYNPSRIILTIFQPRAEGDTVKEWEISRDDLVNWGVFTVRPAAQQAFEGKGDFKPGEWCRFCRARAQCRARAEVNTALEDFRGINAPSKTESGDFPKPPLLTTAEVGEVLNRAIDLEKWVADLKEYALSACLEGKEIPGWKVVEGRSKREFDDITAAFDAIKAAGIDEAMLYERKPLTLAAIEKALGKSKFAEIAGTHVVTPPGKPTLVQESDKRPRYNPRPTAEEDFKEAAG